MTQPSVQVVTSVLSAVEQRRAEALRTLYHPRIEFHWPPGLRYGGSFVGSYVGRLQRRFAEIRQPLQPTEEGLRMDFRVVATGDDGRVVVRYLWKGVDRQGCRFEALTLAEYRVRERLFASARMYRFDLLGLVRFLQQAGAA